MAVVDLAAVTNQIQKFWAPLFEKELRETILLPSLVSRDFEGELKQGGDTVYVSEIVAPVAERRTIGTDADSFASQALTLTRVSIVADQRIVASFELQDLVKLQSQINEDKSDIRDALRFSVEKILNDYLYDSIVAPSASSPDHILNSVSTFSKTEMALLRQRAGEAKWMPNKPWYLLLSPKYAADAGIDAVLANADYTNRADTPVVNGRFGVPRMGFNIFEDNSRSGSYGLAFHPDFCHLVRSQPVFELSSLHSQKKFGYVLSVNFWCGAKLGNEGSKKHMKIIST